MRERTPLESERLLLDVALQFGSTLDLDRLASLVVERVVDLIGAERALFVLFDEHGRIERAVAHNLDWRGPGHPLPISQSVVEEVRRKKELIVVPDAANDREFQAHQSVRLLNLRFILAMPVQTRSEMVGVLYVDSRARALKGLGKLTDTLTALARLVGTAVENARLFEEQAFRNVLLAHLVHEFRSPLTILGSNAEMLQRGNIPPEMVREIADELGATSKKMGHMIDATLSLSRLDAGQQAQLEALDLRSAIGAQVSALRAVAEPLGLRFVTELPEQLPPAHVFPDRVRIVMSNLLFNALKHATAPSEIRIGLALRADSGPIEAADRRNLAAYLFRKAPRLRAVAGASWLEVRVHNRGAPIPDALRPLLFTLYAASGAETQRGHTSTGLGLAIVEQCVRSLGGRVWVRSEAGFGTEFRFTLPTETETAEASA